MGAHIVLSVVGEAGSTSTVLATLWTMIWTWPGMLMAALGTACLLLVLATSVRVVRSRLRYETWHLLHLYAYLGVFFAVPHQLWSGTDFENSRSRRPTGGLYGSPPPAPYSCSGCSCRCGAPAATASS